MLWIICELFTIEQMQAVFQLFINKAIHFLNAVDYINCAAQTSVLIKHFYLNNKIFVITYFK